MTSLQKTISLIIPIYFEEENIPELYRRVKEALLKDFSQVNHEIIFINDGSTDKSFILLKELHQKDTNVKVINFSRNFGHHIAISAGLDYATGDYIVMMDGDLQDQPEEIIKLYNKLQEERADVVYGERINKQFNWFKKINSRIFNILIKKLTSKNIVINSTIFRIMTKQVADSVKQLREQNRYLVGIIGWVGYTHIRQPVEHGKRFKGKSKYNFSKQIKLALNAIFSFSSYPLTIITHIGFYFVLIAFMLIGYIVFKYLFFGTPITGWTSLITSVLLMGGIQIILLGIIGEYIGRNFMEDKQRPLYVTKDLLL